MKNNNERVISKEQYSNLMEAKRLNKYSNYICSINCRLGKEKIFKVKSTDIHIKMICTQIGGMFSGSHCFVLP